MDNTTDIALSRLMAQQRAVDVIAGNLANASTPGFHAQRMVFADWLCPQPGTTTPKGGHTLYFTQDLATYRDQAQGTISRTGNPLDFALSGGGYFTVQTAAGVRLTRAGRFTLQGDGSITDESGNALLDTSGQAFKISPADTDLRVAADGSLSSQNGPIGRIAVVTPNDPYKMTAEGGRLMRADGPTTPVGTPKMIQGAVEDSNVQPISELVTMMSTERDFQFVTQFVEAESQRRSNAIDKIASPNLN